MMELHIVRQALLWCFLMNYLLMLVWFVVFLFPHEWIYRLTSKAFTITRERFNELNFTALVFYKLMVLFFNLVPYVALCIAAKAS